MAVNTIQFGAPEYESPFTVSTGDVDVIKLRSRESAPLSHESLDENFTNLGNKINEILGIGIDALSITDGKIASANLDITNGTGLTYTSGVFAHQARPSAQTGYATADIDYSNRQYISALDFDSLGHVVGYKSSTLNFTGSNGITIDQDTNNEVSITTDAYRSGDSPSFGNITTTGNVGIGTTSPSGLLHLKGDTNERGAELFLQVNNNNTTDTLGAIHFGNNIDSTLTQVLSGSSGANNSSFLALSTSDEGNLEEHMRIDPDGAFLLHPNNVTRGLKITTTQDVAVGDTTTYDAIGAGYGSHIFKTDGTERMRIDSGGNVGIGTTNPDALLDVEGSLDQLNSATIKNTSTTGYGFLTVGGGNGSSRYVADFRDKDNVSCLKIDGNGKVGIGTTGPERRLDVIFNENNSSETDYRNVNGIRIWNTNETVGSLSALMFHTAGSAAGITAERVSTDSVNLHFINESINGVPDSAMSLMHDGSVGIGTKNPRGSLHVNGSNFILGRGHNTASPAAGSIVAPYGVGEDINGGNLNIYGGRSTGTGVGGNISFYTSSSSETSGEGTNNHVNRLLIDSNGNVGIGTQSPQAKLHVNGQLSASSFFLTDSAFEMWHSQYLSVSASSHPRIVQENGNDLEEGGVYRLTAHIHATSTHTGTRAVLWRGEDGLWMINQTTSSGGATNHIEFYVDSTNIPRIRTWHTSGYTVQVLHERIYLNQQGHANDRAIFGMDAMLSQTPEEQTALYFNRQQNKDGTVRGQKLIMDDGFSHVDIDGTLYVNNPYAANTENFSVKVSPTGHLSGQKGYSNAGGVGLFANANYAISGNFNKMDTTIDSMAGIGVKQEGEIEFYTASGLAAGDTTHTLRNSVKMFIGSDGNVGIGTTSPRCLLDLGLGNGDGSEVSNDPADYQLGLHAAQSTTGDIGRSIGFILSSGNVGAAITTADGGTGDATDLLFITGNSTSISEAMRIDSSGNVGIGHTSPGQMLSIKGDESGFSISSEDYENIVYMGRRASTQPDLGYFRLRNASNTTIALDSAGHTYFNGGNVGIGTTTPDALLEVAGGSIMVKSSGPVLILKDTDGGDVNTQTGFISYRDSDDTERGYVGFGTASNKDFTIYNKIDGGINLGTGNSGIKLHISAEGRVGVGTLDPEANLHVDGSALGSTANSSTKHAIIGGDRHWLDFKETRIADAIEGNSWPNTSYRLQMRVDSTNHQAIDFVSDSNSREHIDIYTGNNVFHSRFTYDGNLLIGKDTNTQNTAGTQISATAGARITVDQNICLLLNRTGSDGTISAFRRDGTQTGSISVTTTATSFNTSSDYRLKTDVQAMTGAIERLKALKPVNFEWIADGTRVDGFLAHEAQEVVPEAVTGTKDGMQTEEYEVTPAVYEDIIIPATDEVVDEDGNVITEAQEERTEQKLVSEAVMGEREVPDYQGIDQSKLVPLLTAAIQEQQQVIEELKSRIETLESK